MFYRYGWKKDYINVEGAKKEKGDAKYDRDKSQK
jgi:hypothetical protein